MTTMQLVHPLEGVRLLGPVFGFDLSTKQLAAGIVIPTIVKGGSVGPSTSLSPMPGAPVFRWEAKTIVQHPHAAMQAVMAVDTTTAWLADMEARYGQPGRIGIEIPAAGERTPLVLLYMVQTLLTSIGEQWGAVVPVEQIRIGAWKKPATGHGYAPGLPRSASKSARRKAEKARLLEWAQSSLGYTGLNENEVDGLGVAVATALLEARR